MLTYSLKKLQSHGDQGSATGAGADQTASTPGSSNTGNKKLLRLPTTTCYLQMLKQVHWNSSIEELNATHWISQLQREPGLLCSDIALFSFKMTQKHIHVIWFTLSVQNSMHFMRYWVVYYKQVDIHIKPFFIAKTITDGHFSHVCGWIHTEYLSCNIPKDAWHH